MTFPTLFSNGLKIQTVAISLPLKNVIPAEYSIGEASCKLFINRSLGSNVAVSSFGPCQYLPTSNWLSQCVAGWELEQADKHCSVLPVASLSVQVNPAIMVTAKLYPFVTTICL